MADYYGVSPAVVIMVIWWEGLHYAKTSLDALLRAQMSVCTLMCT